MIRSGRSSLAESFHSLADSTGGDEFLAASPFNPENLERRRAQRDTNVSKAAFQPQFCRIDSMAYLGRGIVEDNDHVAPVAVQSPRERPPQPSPNAGSASGAKSAGGGSGRPPLSNRFVSDNHSAGSAVRRHVGNGDRNGHVHGPKSTNPAASASPSPLSTPPPLTRATRVPAPPASEPGTSPRSGTNCRSLQPGACSGAVTSTTPADTSKVAHSALPVSPPASAFNMCAPKKAAITDSRSPACWPLDSAGGGAPQPVHPSPQVRPPHTPASFHITKSPSCAGAVDQGRKKHWTDRLDLCNAGNRDIRSQADAGCRASFTRGRRRTSDLPDFIAPLSPAKLSAIEGNGLPPSPISRGVGAASSLSSQTSVPALPMLNGQGSSGDNLNSSNVSQQMVVRRRNSSPARVRRPSATTTTAAGSRTTTGVAARAGVPSPPLLGLRGKTSDSKSSNSTKEAPSPSPSPAGRSFGLRVPPTTSGTGVNGRGNWQVPASPKGTVLSAFLASAAPSAVSVLSRSSSSASFSSSTPAASPSVTLRLMADNAPSSRLATATRTTVTQVSRPETAAFHRSSAPPPAPKRRAVVPTPVAVRTASAPNLVQTSASDRNDTGSPSRGSADARQDGVPMDLNAINADFLNKIKKAQRRRSLLDVEGGSMSDSVRRQYYLLPSEEETSIPNFARRAGDLHVKINGSLLAGSSDVTGDGSHRKSSEGDGADSAFFPPASKTPSAPSSLGRKDASSSAVPHNRFWSAGPPTTGESPHTPECSPQSARFILPEPSDAGTDSDGSEDLMEPLMLDATRVYYPESSKTIHAKR
ncbi:hypothetical protein ABB37_00659 [Leptomonas pyrrhocoris]|uniref:Uncharacterized protein n=1 Tax=Leptomonas pyrrhocoris TaxID=157538 RepID=A0A0M9GAV5_LEPPY|nr:hypothetical protein ABB37_00659 [Leptomonas pyrrhocoris]KPA86513.1 hypothetical protein ABB37_00659 [Leptomonas pyrrhocoris]|eukprot:XP_015664952.1 hypothetical protein ABB37_00659 [Leptomonas pyrrhocoris]